MKRPHFRTAIPRRHLLHAGLAALLLNAACGASPTRTASPTASSNSTAAAAAPAIPSLDVSAHEYAFDAPDSVAAGVIRIHLDNTGAEDHQAQLEQLKPGVTAAQYAAAARTGPAATAALAVPAGGPGAQVPNGSGDAFADIQPGQYVFVCNLPGPNGQSHAQLGMVRGLTVTAATIAPAAKAPETKTTVTQREFSFDNPATLPAGQTTLSVKNAGTQAHEMAVVKLKPGVTADQVKASFAGPPSTPASAPAPLYTSAGGIGAIAAGDSDEVTLNLSSGTYALLCFLPDPTLKKQHVALGMVSSFSVP